MKIGSSHRLSLRFLNTFVFPPAIAFAVMCFSLVVGYGQVTSSGQSNGSNNQTATSPLTLPGMSSMVLTNPPPGPVAQFPTFSKQPMKQEIMQARVFSEPLIPIGGEPSQAENIALANALVAYASRTTADDFSALTDYLKSAPSLHWYESVLFCLGLEYYNTGYYSKAIDTWEEAWFWLQDERGGEAESLADRTFGELAKMHSRIGDSERLKELFGELGNHEISGSASELIAGAKQALWLMKNRPEIAYRCGPIALRNICKMIEPAGVDVDEIILSSASTPEKGFSLAQLEKLSQDLHLNFQVAQRSSGAPVVVPSVIHWNVGHYAAILQQDGDRFFVVDPTFGIGRWISKQALDAESSGYFLIPPGPLTNNWQGVSQSVRDNTWGRGVTGNSDPNATTPYDQMAEVFGQATDCLSVLKNRFVACNAKRGNVTKAKFGTLLAVKRKLVIMSGS